MAHFILVHGMFHGGWCWDRLKARLEADGHSVEAPDLAGCGRDETPAREVTLGRWAADIAALVAAAPAPVVLVGHSRGGLVISAAAERASDRIAALVYLTALMLPDGAGARDLPTIMAEEGFVSDTKPPRARLNEAGDAMLPFENAEILFYAACSAEDRAWAASRIGPEPAAPLGASLSLRNARWGRVPRVYVETLRDGTLPIGAQRAMVARVGADEVHSLNADHMPNLTHVGELAAILEDVSRRHVI